eukprot:jgi/Mesvir1/3218/Mv16367-RA.1
MASAGNELNLDLFSHLDDAVLARILSCLPSPKDFGVASSVCRRWNRVAKFPATLSQFAVGIQLMKYEQRILKPTKARGHTGIVTGLTSSGSRLFSTVVEEDCLRIWNTSSRTRSGALRCEHVVRTGFPITALAASGSRLFLVAMGIEMFVWRIDDAGVFPPEQNHPLCLHIGGILSPVYRMVVSGPSRLFVCNSFGCIVAWDISDEQRPPVMERVVQGSREQELESDFIAADEYRLFHAFDAGIKAWNTNALDADPICFGGTLDSPTLTVSGNRLFASSNASGIQVWDIADLARPTCLHNLWCRDIRSLCAWEGFLFAGTGAGMAVWDLRSGRERFIDRRGPGKRAHHALNVPIRSPRGHAFEVFSGLQVLAGQLYATVSLMGFVNSDSRHVMAAWSLQGGS